MSMWPVRSDRPTTGDTGLDEVYVILLTAIGLGVAGVMYSDSLAWFQLAPTTVFTLGLIVAWVISARRARRDSGAGGSSPPGESPVNNYREWAGNALLAIGLLAGALVLILAA